MKSPAMYWLGQISWLLVSLAAINDGLCPLGFDFYKTQLMTTTFAGLGAPLMYLVGLAGLWSLYGFVMRCMGKNVC